MKALLYKSHGEVECSEVSEPSPGVDDVIVRVHASGICHTDIDILYGRYGNSSFPLVPGHEYAGEIVATGSNVSGFTEGRRVVIDPNIHCGNCRACKKGMTNLCDKLGAYGVTVNGGFAQYSAVHKDNVFPINDLPYGIAALAEPVGCVLNGIDAFDTDAIDNAMIFGAGPIGMLMALCLRTKGVSDVTMVDLEESRLVLAESFGLNAVAAGSDRLAAMERSMDLTVDATGVLQVAQRLIHYTANGGNVLFFGVCAPGETIAISPHDIFRRQIRVAGTHSLNHNIPEALGAIESIGPDIELLVSHRVELGDIKGYLDKSSEQTGSLKIHAVFD